MKLSICIPTYNREKLLRETIDSIVDQLSADIAGDVEVVISDNASTDNTEELINTYKSRFGNFVYYRWPQNMGADRNYLKVIELAHGQYCWFLGSDDKLSDGSLRRMFDEIQSDAPDIILFDRAESDASLSTTPVASSWTNLAGSFSFDSRTEKDKFHYYLNNCNSVGGIFSFLSVIVFKKDKWDAIPNKDRFVGSAYVHVHGLMGMLKEGARFHYLKESLVICRLGNDSFCPDPTSYLAKYNRWKLDIDGYRDIPMFVFGSDSSEYLCIHRLVGRYLQTECFVPIRSLMKKEAGSAYDNKVELLFLNNGFYGKYFLLRLSQVKLFFKLLKTFRRLRNSYFS